MRCLMSSMETSEPEFYYLLRDKSGEIVGVHTSGLSYANNATLGEYRLEKTTKAYVETIKEFRCFDIDGIISDDSDIGGILM